MKYSQVAKALLAYKHKDINIFSSFGLYSEFNEIKELIKQNKASVLSGKFYSWYKEDETPNIFEERTFPGCLEMVFNIQDSVLQITMWDGESLYGERQTKRCHWKVKVNPASILWIKDPAVKLLRDLAKSIREEQIRKQEEERVEFILQELLADTLTVTFR